MIYEVFSTLPSFKRLSFRPGLNVLVADRTDASTERQTRNRAGKSSLVEVVHFVLGAKADRESIFRNPSLADFKFGLRLDLDGQTATAERSGSEPSRVLIDASDTAAWPVKPKVRDSDPPSLSNEDWKELLGRFWFKLVPEEVSEGPHRPTLRSLLSYFARRESAKGFLEPVRQSEDQSKWDQQVALSFLIGLDWTVAQRLELVRRQEKALAELRRAAKEGAIGTLIPKASELQTQLVLATKEADRVRRTLESFDVLPEYHELEREASRLTLKINGLVDENTLDVQLLETMESALREEAVPSEAAVEKVYAEAGLVLPDAVQKRLEEVRTFHRSVVSNRRGYLQSEISGARDRMLKRDQEKAIHDQRRGEIMRLLRSRGALDQFQQLQREQARLDATVESLKQRFRAAQQLESSKVDLDIERRQIESRLRLNLQEQNARVEKAIQVFEEISESLYEDAGNLVLTPTPNGLEVEIKIQGQRSKGIQNMQIFCFDMMLMQLCADRGVGPGFVIHDSHLFDGVDERQVAGALAVGARKAEACGWQYIVTMNSDVMPPSFPGGFDITPHLLPERLTDAREDGGLFGIRF
jgi:uncharacterized protein YydD (DUF2326 family)